MLEFNNQIIAELEIDDPSNSGARVFASLGAAFKNVSANLGENVYTASYLDMEGFSSSEVSGLNYTITLNGDYVRGDPVIEYIFSPDVLHGIGEARKSRLRITKAGRVVTWNVTMTKIRESGGDANEPVAVLLELKGNGKPSVSAL